MLKWHPSTMTILVVLALIVVAIFAGSLGLIAWPLVIAYAVLILYLFDRLPRRAETQAAHRRSPIARRPCRGRDGGD